MLDYPDRKELAAKMKEASTSRQNSTKQVCIMEAMVEAAAGSDEEASNLTRTAHPLNEESMSKTEERESRWKGGLSIGKKISYYWCQGPNKMIECPTRKKVAVEKEKVIVEEEAAEEKEEEEKTGPAQLGSESTEEATWPASCGEKQELRTPEEENTGVRKMGSKDPSQGKGDAQLEEKDSDANKVDFDGDEGKKLSEDEGDNPSQPILETEWDWVGDEGKKTRGVAFRYGDITQWAPRVMNLNTCSTTTHPTPQRAVTFKTPNKFCSTTSKWGKEKGGEGIKRSSPTSEGDAGVQEE